MSTGGFSISALECSVALLATDGRGGLVMGTAIAVLWGERVLLATAAHNLVGSRGRLLGELRVVPRGRYRANPVRIVGVGVAMGKAAPDVGWVEVDRGSAERAGLMCLAVDRLGAGAGGGDALEVHGFPAVGIDSQRIAGTRFVLDRGTLTGRVVEPEQDAVGFRAGFDLAITARSSGAPRGFSGGGVWTGSRRVVALARSWNQRRGLLFCTRIEHWLALVRADFPDGSGLASDAPSGDNVQPPARCRVADRRGGSL